MLNNKSKLLSQNFLRDKDLAHKLVGLASFGKNDLVLDIGAGTGALTVELAKTCGQVMAIEIDPNLIPSLSKKVSPYQNVSIYNQDFRSFNLPKIPYKVFANLPFWLTGEILAKLLQTSNPPIASLVIVQQEAAEKFAGNSLVAALYYPWFQFTIKHTFRPDDFYPKPMVNIVLLQIIQRTKPLLATSERHRYEDFVTYAFSRKKPYMAVPPVNPTLVPLPIWLEFYGKNKPKLKRITGYAAKLFNEQSRLQKIHRTRNDTRWKQFSTHL